MKTLYIIDASGFLYRSYFAIRNITNAKGESTNALYGFIRSILKLRKDFHPDHLVAVFDGPHGSKPRTDMYADYKAHRTAMPADLVYQIGWAQEACKLMGISYLSVPEVEADDTMGSIAVWASKHGVKVYLCTSDKDLCQLVNENINVLNTHKENLILDPKGVEEAFGVSPKQIVDFLAITGDSSDNVPGLPGFGPKTAVTLLNQYGSLDYILNHPEVASGKKQETIVKFGEQALLSRRLVTIDTAVDFPKDNHYFSIKPINASLLKEFYASMNFNSLIRELEQSPPTSGQIETPAVVEAFTNYMLVDDEPAFSKLMKHLSTQTQIAITTLATDPLPMKAELVGISFSIQENEAWFIPLKGKLGQKHVLDGLKGLLANEHISFYGHNLKSDLLLLGQHNISIKKLSFDTMLASYLMNSHNRQHSLEQLMLDVLGKVKMPLSVLVGKGKKIISIDEVPIESLKLFSCEEIDYICRLKNILEPQLHERKLTPLLMDLELPLLRVLSEMERKGIYIDVPYLHKMSGEINQLISGLAQEIYDLAGESFNINSPKQLSEILFGKLGIKPPKKTATGHSTNADVLDILKPFYPIAGKILEYRTYEKLRSTYIDTLPMEVNSHTQRIHCTFNQTVAATGRLSCQNPNLQNIPIRTEIGKKIRKAFRPQKEGWSYLAADYSQIELRLLAHMSDDPNLVDAFLKGEDIHTFTASLIFNIPISEVTKEQRYGAKAVNFGVVYGQQAYGLAQELGIDIGKAGAFIDTYFKRYPRVKDFLASAKEYAHKTGKAVTYTGRERLIPEINSRNGQLRALAERLAVNTPLQGTAADLIKMAMLKIDQKFQEHKFEGYMILQIHDELIFEVPDKEIEQIEPIVRETMQEVLSLKVPLVVDITIGKNWAEC